MSHTVTASQETGAGPLSTVVYHSRAALPLSPPELHQLTVAAQARNRAESVTGLMLYDESDFFQWLEGPADGVDRIMRSIRRDQRHTDLEVLVSRPSRARVFGDWDMKCATKVPAAAPWDDELLQPPPEIVESLRQCPEAAPVLLVKLVPIADTTAISETVERLSLRANRQTVLKRVFLSTVVPTLLDRHPLPSAPPRIWPIHVQAAELAGLLIGANQTAAWDLIANLFAHEASIWPLYATLFEPAARMLGDRWDNDDCSEFDVTLGLSRLQTAARHFSHDIAPAAAVVIDEPVVLIAPEPGELHGLGAALDSEVLWHAGWHPRCEFPASDKALQELVSATWFDALDLSLSVAFRREHDLARLTNTIARARRASRNPALAVVVGGRVFIEEAAAGANVGADMASTTSLGIEQTIQQGMERRAATLDGDKQRTRRHKHAHG